MIPADRIYHVECLMFSEGENESDTGDKIVIDILWFNYGAAILKLMNIYKNNYNFRKTTYLNTKSKEICPWSIIPKTHGKPSWYLFLV